MNEATGTFRDGRVELDSAVDWPDGARVTVLADHAGDTIQGVEAEWDRRDLAEILAGLDAIEPLELTPQEEQRITAFRDAVAGESQDAVRRAMGLPKP